MEKITTSGSALVITKVGERSEFRIHNVENLQLLNVKIEGPNNIKCNPILSVSDTNEVIAEFQPIITGEYVIHISYDNLAIPNSPFTSKVYDINQIKVIDMPKVIQINRPASFVVCADSAGPGMLEVIINKGKISSVPKSLGPAKYSITFVPIELIDHNIQIIFNNEFVNGSPFILKTIQTSIPRVIKPQNDRISVNSPFIFQIKSPINIDINEEMFFISTPLQKRIKPEIKLIDNKLIKETIDNSKELDDELNYEIKFISEEVGDHLVDLKYDNQSISGCPFLVKFYDSRKIKVSDLNSGILGKPVYFSIDASNAGAGNLEIIVSVNKGINSRKIPNYVESKGNAKFRVNFKPKEAIPHFISIKFNEENVPGSPYTMQIHLDNQNEIDLASIVSNLDKLRMCSLSKGIRLILNKYSINQTLNKIATNLPPNIKPTGHPEIIIHTPTNQKQNLELIDKQSEYEGLYIAKEVGPYQIFVYIDKYHINSINCNVYDVSKVKVSGLEMAILGKPITFQVDASHAGEGTLELVVTTRKCSVSAEVLMRSRGLYDVTFIPKQQTQYYINVTFNEEDVPGSPFKVDIQSPNGLEKLSQLTISDQMHANTDVVDRVSFPSTSLENQNEFIQQVQSPTNNKLLPSANSQFDPNKIVKGVASTENATCLVGSINIVYIELDNNLFEQLQNFQKQQHAIEACVFNPQGSLINSNLTYDLLSNKNSNKFKLEYLPKEIGTYRIELINSMNQQSLLNNPIYIECCDPSRVKLLNVTDGIVNKQQQFTVDCSKAGCGVLQLSITCRQQEIPFELFEYGPNNTQIKISSLSSNSNTTKINSKGGIFLVKYKPEIDLPHYINSLYNGHQAPGCPQLIQVNDPAELLTIVSDSINKSIQINMDTEILIEESSITGLIELGEFNCKIFDSDNQLVKNRLIELPDLNGSKKKQFKLQFRPIKIGTHRIEIYYLNNHLNGSPFLSECFDINKVKLQPIQNTNFIVNEKIVLSIDRKDAGYASLDVIVVSPLGRHLPVELKAIDQKESIHFIPTVEGKYKIAISYGNLPVPGTPITFVANQSTNNQNNSPIKTNGESQTHLKLQQPLTNGHQITNHSTNNNNSSNLINSVSNHSPNNQNNQQQINSKDQQPIVMFKQMSGTVNCRSINERFAFTIDSNGFKGLPLITIDGPVQEEDLLVEEKNQIFFCSFIPVKIGNYEIKITFNGKEISKPFKINIVNLNAIKPKQDWKALFTNADTQSIIFNLNQQFKITFLTNDAGQGKLLGEIVLPNGKIQGNIIEHTSTNKYKLYFTPFLNGKYLIKLYYSGLLLPKCPIVACTSPQYLKALNGNATLDNHINNQINNQILNGLQKDNNLNHQQRKLSANNHDNEEVCVTLKGQGLAGALVGQIGQFIVDGTAAGSGSPQCTLKISENEFKFTDKNEENRPVLNVTEIQNKVFKVSYKAKIAGTYILNILWGNKQVSGCPLTLNITSNSDADLVEVKGSSLKEAVINKLCKIQIDTSKASPGQLSAHCMGPKKVAACSLIDEQNGIYQLNFTPLEIGKHILTIKYGNENIPGSPFTIKVNSQNNGNEPDASKVRTFGPGLEHGVLPLYQSRFVCETKGAGPGSITVRIRGPKGAFRVEMARDNTKDRLILCKYDPTEPGHYRIEIKWSGEHVPNSPFDVYIFDTQFELNRFLQNSNGQLNERLQPPMSALSNFAPTSTGTLPLPHQTALLAPQPISFHHKTLPNPLVHSHLPMPHPIQINPHYSLNHHLPAAFAAPINPQFLNTINSAEFFNPHYAYANFRGPHELH